MRKTARLLLLASLVSTGTGFGLVACLDDYKVLPPATDSGALPGSDSSTTPPVDFGGSTDGSTGTDSAVAPDVDAGPAPTHCDGVIAPPGAVDFLCADFDSPVLEKGWDSVTRTDGGLAEQSMAVATSQPFSLVTNTVGFGSATLSWKKSGAVAFTEATTVVQVNPGQLGGVAPPSTGTMELVHMTTSNASVTFGYSRGSTEFDGAQYTGYFIYNAAFGGAAAISRTKITAVQLIPNVWTEVKIVWGSDGKLNVFYNNINVLGINGFSTNDTAVTFRLGASAGGDVGAMPVHRFDDARMSIRR